MKIVGVSNPKFTGVTVATKSYINQYIPFNPDFATANSVMTQVLVYKPDMLIIGGWGGGFDQFSSYIPNRASRDYAVMCVWHGTFFHNSFMDDSQFFEQAKTAYRDGKVDYFGFAHIEMARYFTERLGMRAVWVPHSFKIQERIVRPDPFRIGSFGGQDPWKSVAGQKLIIRDFCERHPRTEPVHYYNPKSGRDLFFDILRGCGIVTHLSSLECYPNVVLEAWSHGIPVIIGPASETVIKNPLVKSKQLKTRMLQFLLSSHLNANELYGAIEKVYLSWNYYQDTVCDYYELLRQETQIYLKETLKSLCESYTLQKTQSLVLPSICTELLTSTGRYNPDSSGPTKLMAPESSVTT